MFSRPAPGGRTGRGTGPGASRSGTRADEVGGTRVRRLDGEEVELMIDGLGRIGGFGARFMARLLPTNIHEISVILDGDPQAVCKRAVNLVTKDGDLVAQRQPSPGVLEVRGLIGAGTARLNPTVVTVRVSGRHGGGSRVQVRAVAKEGLVKQHAGKKTATRYLDQLTARSRPPRE